MKIIKQKHFNISRLLFKYKCNLCGSKLGVEYEDIHMYGISPIFDCPICGKRNQLTSWDVEKYIKINLWLDHIKNGD